MRAASRWIRNDQTTWLYSLLDALSAGTLGARARHGRRGHSVRLATAAAALSVAVYLAGLFVALGGGFLHLYVETRPIYLLTAAIAWVAFWGGWADRRLRDLEDDIGPVFADRPAFHEAYSRGRRRVFSRARDVRWSLFWILLSASYLSYAIFIRGTFTTVPTAWATGENRLLKEVALLLFLIPAIGLMVTMLSGAHDYSRLSHRLARVPLTPQNDLAKLRIRPFLAWGTFAGFGWTIGISMCIFLFRFAPGIGDKTPRGAGLVVPVAFLTAAALWGGIFLIVLPQYAFHIALKNVKLRLLDACDEHLANLQGEGQTTPRDYVQLISSERSYEQVTRLAREIAVTSEWAFATSGEVTAFAAQVVLPIIALVVTLAVPQ